MSTFTGVTKQANATFTPASKNVVTVHPYTKSGQGVPYDSPAEYDDDLDPISGNPLFYDAAGSETTWTNIPKS